MYGLGYQLDLLHYGCIIRYGRRSFSPCSQLPDESVDVVHIPSVQDDLQTCAFQLLNKFSVVPSHKYLGNISGQGQADGTTLGLFPNLTVEDIQVV